MSIEHNVHLEPIYSIYGRQSKLSLGGKDSMLIFLKTVATVETFLLTLRPR